LSDNIIFVACQVLSFLGFNFVSNLLLFQVLGVEVGVFIFAVVFSKGVLLFFDCSNISKASLIKISGSFNCCNFFHIKSLAHHFITFGITFFGSHNKLNNHSAISHNHSILE
jgi:hypothetical protein